MTQTVATSVAVKLPCPVEYHLYAVALHTMCYNFVRAHGTLTKANGGIKTTPAMAAGVADRLWTVGDLLKLLQPA
ncbi:MAG: hypothetical protein EXR92_01340 [Gemmatimonadetes bacterium]|nr:hypothetical protein [Gemmatimonadota bacterium]